MMHHDTIFVSEYCRFLNNLDDLSWYCLRIFQIFKDLDDLSWSLVSKLHTKAVHLECELYHQFNTIFYAKQAPFMFLNDISLGNKLQNAVNRVKTYINKNYQNY